MHVPYGPARVLLGFSLGLTVSRKERWAGAKKGTQARKNGLRVQIQTPPGPGTQLTELGRSGVKGVLAGRGVDVQAGLARSLWRSSD